MAWCSHCITVCETRITGQFVSCSRCGKVLAEVVPVLKNSKSEKVRSNRRKRNKKIRDKTLCIDKSEFYLEVYKLVQELSQKYSETVSTSNVCEETTCSSQTTCDDQVLFSMEESTAGSQSTDNQQ